MSNVPIGIMTQKHNDTKGSAHGGAFLTDKTVKSVKPVKIVNLVYLVYLVNLANLVNLR